MLLGRSWMIEAGDVLQPWQPRHRVRCEPPRHHRRFDAPLVEPTACPVARNREVVEYDLERRQPMLERARKRERVAVRRIDVGAVVLRVDRLAKQHVPPKTALVARARPQVDEIALEE